MARVFLLMLLVFSCVHADPNLIPNCLKTFRGIEYDSFADDPYIRLQYAANGGLELPGGKLLAVPPLIQPNNADCGVISVQAVLAYFGKPALSRAIRPHLGTDPLLGTDLDRMTAFLRYQGLEVEERVLKTRQRTGKSFGNPMTLSELEVSIDKGHPVIVLIQAYAKGVKYPNAMEWGHYAIAIGYDTEKVIFMDPTNHGTYKFLPKPEFVSRWKTVDSKHQLFERAGIIVRGQAPSAVTNGLSHHTADFLNVPLVPKLTPSDHEAAIAYSIIDYLTLDHYQDDIQRKIQPGIAGLQLLLKDYGIPSDRRTISTLNQLDSSILNRDLPVAFDPHKKTAAIVAGFQSSKYSLMDPDIVGKYRLVDGSDIMRMAKKAGEVLVVRKQRERPLRFDEVYYMR